MSKSPSPSSLSPSAAPPGGAPPQLVDIVCASTSQAFSSLGEPVSLRTPDIARVVNTPSLGVATSRVVAKFGRSSQDPYLVISSLGNQPQSNDY